MKKLSLVLLMIGLLFGCNQLTNPEPPNTDCWIEVRNLYPDNTLKFIKYNGQFAMYTEKNKFTEGTNASISFNKSIWIKIDEAHQGLYPIQFQVANGGFYKTGETYSTTPGKIVTVEITANTLVSDL